MAGWGQGFFEGAGTLAGSIGEGLLAALRPDDPRDRNPTGLTAQQFAALQRGESITPPQRPGLGESLLGLTPVPSLVDAWKASDTAGEGGYEGGRATAAALGNLAMLMVPGSKALKAEARAPIRAFHGSPHSFDRFDAGKIGTGEGAQAYGYGHYFAEKEGVARSYRDALSGDAMLLGGQKIVPQPGSAGEMALAHLRSVPQGWEPYPEARKSLRSLRDAPESNARSRAAADAALKQLDEWQMAGGAPGAAGHMYEVGLHADPARFLDWDKPLSAQSLPNMGEVDRLLAHAPVRPTSGVSQGPYTVAELAEHGATGRDLYDRAAWAAGKQGAFPEINVSQPVGATKALGEAGIPGIRYLDQGSRSAGQGSHNLVVFPGNEHLIEILRKYGLLPAAALPAAAAVPGLLSQPGEQ